MFNLFKFATLSLAAATVTLASMPNATAAGMARSGELTTGQELLVNDSSAGMKTARRRVIRVRRRRTIRVRRRRRVRRIRRRVCYRRYYRTRYGRLRSRRVCRVRYLRFY